MWNTPDVTITRSLYQAQQNIDFLFYGGNDPSEDRNHILQFDLHAALLVIFREARAALLKGQTKSNYFNPL